ncbi:secreted RxLR effector protein 161-like [Cornus florida]|uniref:secreted RxLR effector protein 161-like n=1 Tax=Cornus florida TaxID=4283 RepID=UPI00289F4D24|nr:secreted RxLR effector protein 161-like [Cornus florida]
MLAFGYRQSNSDHTFFLKKQYSKITALIVYVDDIVVIGNDHKEMKALKKYLFGEFEMKDLAETSVEEGLKLCVESNQVPANKGRYQRLVGRLMYLAHTRLDLAYALSIVTQFIHDCGKKHMNAVMRILRYLKSGPGKGILFTKNAGYQNIDAYTDADWAGAIDDMQSTSGYFTFVGGNLVT